MANDFTPMYQGDLEPLIPQFVDGNGNPIPLTNLTGTAISMSMKNTRTGQVIVCQGNWTITDQASAIAVYQWLPGETATVGFWSIEITVQYPSGAETFGPDGIPPLEIRAKF